MQFEIAAERVTRQWHVVKLAVLHQCQRLATIIGKHHAQAAEFVVYQLHHACQTPKLPQVHVGNLHIAFVACIVFDR